LAALRVNVNASSLDTLIIPSNIFVFKIEGIKPAPIPCRDEEQESPAQYRR